MSSLIKWLNEQLDDAEFREQNPVEAMADIKAKRAIVAACERVYRAKDREYGDGAHDLADEILDSLASAYADSPSAGKGAG